MIFTRSYNLQIDPNFHKFEDVRYTASRYRIYLQHFVTKLYYNTMVRFFSTKGMGMLANQAQKRAMGIVSGIRVLGGKSNCPQMEVNICPAEISPAKDTSFDYWLNVNSQWGNKVKIPVRSHGKLNEKLRTGWKLSTYCEITEAKNGKWYARVFVTKKVDKPLPQARSLGVDVGIAHGVARSDGYLGTPLKRIMRQERFSQSERRRQHHPKKPFKTKLKQQLDVEVTRALARCKRDSLNLVVEHPKVLSNLRIDRWARSYFANRASMRAQEEGVYVQWVNPAYTSITCSKCGHTDKQSRVKQSVFRCTACGNTVNADYNAAINIARKGQERLLKKRPITALQSSCQG